MRLLLACLFGWAVFWAASFHDSASPTAWGSDPPAPALAARSGSGSADSDGSGPSEVERLIEKLGSPSYASRLRAKQKLQRMGLEAFEELQRAQYHADSEIAMASRHLVSSLLVSWSTESDPPKVRETLHEYGAQGKAERQQRIARLAELPHRQALPALTRLVRYETDLKLSREAALSLMRQSMSGDAATRRRHSEAILGTLGSNDRAASQWLRVYAGDLASGGYAADQWQQLVRRQRRGTEDSSSAQVSSEAILELVRACATRAAEVGRRDAALNLVTDNLDLVSPTTRALMDIASWAIDNELHPVVLELRDRHGRMFEDQPLLLYSAAEAFLAAGDQEQAEALADRALQINPLPQDETTRKAMSPKRIEEIGHGHRELGAELQQRGLFRWAEREYRHVIDSLELITLPSPASRADLASMLGDQQRHAEVIEVLQPLVERIESDRDLMRRLQTVHFSYRSLHSKLEFHRGLLAAERGRSEAAKPHLKRALEMDQANIDILIAMYRLDGGESWNEEVRQKLRQTIQVLGNQVRTAEVQTQQMGALGVGDQQLAQLLNQYAWLVCNTEGDYQKALRYSQRSLELLPEQPALLDTCARCYFAAGDYQRAVATQRRAVQLMPHSPPMLRQLEEFEAKLEEESGEEARANREGDGET